ncbi:MAG: Gfo/Idh/MocA family oxidoreductase [Blastocatellia bacterium]
MIGIGVVGYGYWGPNLVRNFAEAPGATLVSVSDLRVERLVEAQRRYPFLKTAEQFRDVLADPSIHAVAIATPVSSHFDLAMQALESNKHVLIEKPLAADAEKAARLIDEANRRKLVLMVDHTFVYTGAVRKIRDLVAAGDLGDIYYYDSVRVNLGLFQHDVSVIWDLAVHDLAILDFVLPSKPVAVSATGISHITGQPENVAYITLFFSDSKIAHLHVNWLAPVKVRRTLIGGSERMIVYDDLEPSEKVKVYDKGVTVSPGREQVYELLVSYRSGDMWAPKLDQTEGLQKEVRHFIDCIEHNKSPETDGAAGLRVVSLLDAAERSMHQRGRLVEL